MADVPAFANTPVIWKGSVSVANTNRDGTGTTVTLGSAAVKGTRIDRIRVKSTGQPADSLVNIFLHDGTNYWLFDEFDYNAPAAGSTTIGTYGEDRLYNDLVLPSGWSLRASVTVAPTSGVLNVLAFGADLT